MTSTAMFSCGSCRRRTGRNADVSGKQRQATNSVRTAIRLGEEVAKASNRSLNENAVFSREGIQKERQKKEIGFSVVRGGDIVGDHTVLYAGDGERIELTHKASSRTTFSKGATKAAKYINNQTKGLFDMFDVLNLKK